MVKNTKDIEDIFCFLIPMLEDNLLMPNEAVAEIVPFMNVTLSDNAKSGEEWHIGNLAWRNATIPVISLERVRGVQDLGDIHRSKVAVIYTQNGNQEIPYLAFTVQGIPRMIPVNDTESEILDSSPKEEEVMAWVKVADRKAMIPDMDALEEMAKTIR